MEHKVWLVTGISGGLGKALCQALIARGEFVVGTFRDLEQAAAFNKKYPLKALGLVMDLTIPEQVEEVVDRVINQFGRIDVLVNNAGYGFAGAVEEASMDEVRSVFEANFFGTLHLTQLVLPHMRDQKKGHIVQISSHGGVKAFPGFGIYNASKFALEGLSEALSQEVAPLGIKVSIVEPGPFRTGFAGRNLKLSEQVIPEYHETVGVFKQKLNAVHGKQEGDPKKAAEAVIRMVHEQWDVLRLPLGKIALASIQGKLESIEHDIAFTKDVASKAVFVE